MDQYIGKFLDNRYEILEQIGSGGMAVVYKAKCHRLNRMVAIKILRENLMVDDDIRRRFHDEAQAVAMLSSPNIVSVYDVGQFEGADYIVMELIEGITLKEYMQKRGSELNWREALHFMTQIMQALRHAHSRGIVHRDIKPQNIMVLRDGSVKVADFGIARIMDSQKTLTREAFGSVHYVSPEQAKGIHVDARSDIYSAGVVLYEMLTCRLPFDGDTPVSIALQHINSVAVPPREINPDVPVGLEQICMKAMCARLELRYPDAQSVLHDLEEFRRDPSIVLPYGNPWTGASAPQAAATVSPVPQTTSGLSGQEEVQRFQNTAAREEFEDEQRRKKGNVIFTCAVIAIVAVIIVICFMLYKNFLEQLLSPGEIHEVPNLVNMTVDEAKETIAKEYDGHFEVVCARAQYDDSVEAGHIISQTPDSGASTKSDLTTINVIVSSGIQTDDTLYMPSIVRQDYRTAEAKLTNDYGVVVEYADRVYSSTIAEGRIVSTDPVAGSPLKAGQTVTLYVSQGPEIKTVVMPSLIGLDKGQAVDLLHSSGLELGECVEVAGSESAGSVIYQSVKAYTDVDPGTEVYIQISDGSFGGNESAQREPETAEPEISAVEEPVTATPVYQISVPVSSEVQSNDILALSENAEEVTVTVTVSGEVILNVTCPKDTEQLSSVYQGEINDVIVLINGVQTKNFDCIDISQP